jgi:hypothetical protein
MGTKEPRLLSDVTRMGCVLFVTCRPCRNTATIVPAELFKLYNADRALEALRFRCRCGSRDVRLELRPAR